MIHPFDFIELLPLRPGITVADIGSGAGHYTKAISYAVGENGTVFAVDVSEAALNSLIIDVSRSNIENIIPVHANAEHSLSDVGQGVCDIALLQNILGYNDNVSAILQNALSILKESGKIIIVEYTSQVAGKIPHSDVMYDIERLETIAPQLGLRQYAKRDVGQYQTMVVLGK